MLILMLPGVLVHAQTGTDWEVLGPGGGGSTFYPSISPHDSSQVLVACDMTGAYLTRNGSVSWRSFNLGVDTKQFIWDPRDSLVIYARASRALHRSNDGGKAWERVYPPSNQISGVNSSNDYAAPIYLVDDNPAPEMTAMAVDPTHSATLYAGIGSALSASLNRGASWVKEIDLPSPARRIWASGEVVYAATDRAIWTRRNGAWREGAAFLGPWIDLSGSGEAVYAVSSTGGAFSSDGGRSWSALVLPGGARPTAVAASAGHPDVAYVGFEDLKQENRNLFGVLKTIDRGKSWRIVLGQDAGIAGNLSEAWIVPELGAAYPGSPLGLAVAPNNPDICYATDQGRVLRTLDGGATWQSLYSRPSPRGWTSTGLDVTTAYGVHFDPFERARIFVSYTDIGLFRSEDRGRSWTIAIKGIPDQWINTTYWMVFDPAVRGKVWAVVSGTHDLPRPKMWRRTSPAAFTGGVVTSDDGGRTWRQSNGGMGETAATHIMLDPDSPTEARVLYAAGFGKGVYKSVDSGRSWALKNAGIEQVHPFVWRLEPDAKGGIYAIVARASYDGEIGNAGDGALYYSSDGAESWRRIPLPAGVNGPTALTADPIRPKRLYLSAWTRVGDHSRRSGAIFVSSDAGATWKQVFRKDQHVYDVAIDPRDSRVLYACGFESSAWISRDGGETWQRIRGYDFKWGHRVIPDPADPSKIYVTTFGGSGWHGPAIGERGGPASAALRPNSIAVPSKPGS